MPRFDYQLMVQTALRGVVRLALEELAEHGFSGAHHFYITFRTEHPGVLIPDTLRSSYPEHMTIVLQHQFWALEVDHEEFSVQLAFGGRRQHLTVPYDAIEMFSDPEAEFGLRFEPPDEDGDAELDEAPAVSGEEHSPAGADADAADEEGEGKVVQFDRFRKK